LSLAYIIERSDDLMAFLYTEPHLETPAHAAELLLFNISDF
jgi:hypothetical protein